jgi:hypothetical protein
MQLVLGAVENQRAAATEHEEVLLLVLRVVVGVGLARLQDADVDPDFGERLVELLEHDHCAGRRMPIPAAHAGSR